MPFSAFVRVISQRDKCEVFAAFRLYNRPLPVPSLLRRPGRVHTTPAAWAEIRPGRQLAAAFFTSLQNKPSFRFLRIRQNKALFRAFRPCLCGDTTAGRKIELRRAVRRVAQNARNYPTALWIIPKGGFFILFP